MDKKLLFGTFICFFSWQVKAQIDWAEIEFWTGNGSDSTLLVVSFNNGESDSSYVWAYRYNNGETGEDLINAIAVADPNFSVNISGGFLNDVIYHRHSGIGGSPDYWSTWSGADTASLISNAGISTPLVNGEWFALSYTDFNPALKPGLPIPAFNPEAFNFSMVDTWVGSGTDSAVMIIDFQLAGDSARLSYGVLFNDSIQASQVLNDLDQNDPLLNVNASSFLNDISYGSWSGIGGSPNYWSTWSGTNIGNWYLNSGIGTWIKAGELFGCSYTDFSPALRPRVPDQGQNIGQIEFPELNYSFYPNPAQDQLRLSCERACFIQIIKQDGKLYWEGQIDEVAEIKLGSWPRGAYWIQAGNSSDLLILN